MYHPTELSLIFRPDETKKTRIRLDSLQKDIINGNIHSIYKIQIHCVIHCSVYGENVERHLDKFEKDYTFYWS